MRTLIRPSTLAALVGLAGCYAGTDGGDPTDPQGPPDPPAVPHEVSVTVVGDVMTEPPSSLWGWYADVRAFGPDCFSSPGIVTATEVTFAADKGGPAYRAVIRMQETPPGDGCVEVSLVYRRTYSNPAPPAQVKVLTVPVRFTVNGDQPNVPSYRLNFTLTE